MPGICKLYPAGKCIVVTHRSAAYPFICRDIMGRRQDHRTDSGKQGKADDVDIPGFSFGVVPDYSDIVDHTSIRDLSWHPQFCKKE